QVYSTDASGMASSIVRGFAIRDADGNTVRLNNFRALTAHRNYSVYLRDSWVVDWAPGLVLNIGVRWEGQEPFGGNFDSSTYIQNMNNPSINYGSPAIGIYDNWAPRIGFVYDFTQLSDRPGRGKIYFNYGRFYESIPTDISDRYFSGQGGYFTFA